MSAARYNLVIDQGSDFAINFTVKEDGSAKNLTGYSARAQMRTSKTASSVAATFTCTISTPANGTVTMSLPNANIDKSLKNRTGRLLTTTPSSKGKIIELWYYILFKYINIYIYIYLNNREIDSI